MYAPSLSLLLSLLPPFYLSPPLSLPLPPSLLLSNNINPYIPGVFILDSLVLGAVSDVLAGCLALLAAGVIALTSRLNSDWLDDVGVATEPAPSAKFYITNLWCIKY